MEKWKELLCAYTANKNIILNDYDNKKNLMMIANYAKRHCIRGMYVGY